MLHCLRCVPPNFVFDSRMLRLCGYLSVGQLNNGKWLNIPFYFNNEWRRNYRIRSRKLYRVYQKKVHSWKKFTKVRRARNLRKLSVSLCILTFSGSVFRAGKLLPCKHPSMHKITLKSCKEIAFDATSVSQK